MNGEPVESNWVYGGVFVGAGDYSIIYTYDPIDKFPVYSDTVGQYTGLHDATKWESLTEKEQQELLRNHKKEDWNGRQIFEGDIIRYNTYDDFDCYSVVKFGEYEQDGSSGEYNPMDCVGWYAEVYSFTCPDWAENDPIYFNDYLKQQNLLEVNLECEIIGNIYDNPELRGI